MTVEKTLKNRIVNKSLMLVLAVGVALAMMWAYTAQSGDSPTVAGEQSVVATFAGGCFWCMEPPYDKLDGVKATISGYIDGHKQNPSYKEVSSGATGHTEAIQITYDPTKISYEKLLEVFWRNIDPTTVDRQFCDGGSQYRTGIYFHNEQQALAAEASKSSLENTKPFKEPIVTEIKAATKFYPAEDYHQDYYLKNPVRYKFYRYNCGRDKRLSEIWSAKN